MTRQDVAWLIAGCLCFAVLLAVRDGLTGVWLRAGAAGLAFAVLGIAITRATRGRRANRISTRVS